MTGGSGGGRFMGRGCSGEPGGAVIVPECSGVLRALRVDDLI